MTTSQIRLDCALVRPPKTQVGSMVYFLANAPCALLTGNLLHIDLIETDTEYPSGTLLDVVGEGELWRFWHKHMPWLGSDITFTIHCLKLDTWVY